MISAKNIVSPSQPGITAALGLLVSDLKYEYTRSVLIPLNQTTDGDLAQINEIVEDLKSEANKQLDQDNVPKDSRQYEYIMEFSRGIN